MTARIRRRAHDARGHDQCGSEYECDNCNAKLIITTGAGGSLDGALPRRIDYAGTWYHLPSHLPRGKRAFRREKFRRGGSKIQARIRAASLVGEAPAVKFRS